MKIIQLNPTNDTMWDVLSRNDVYLVRFSEPKAKKTDGHKREMPPLPYGLSFRRVGNITVSELIELLNSKEVAIVQVMREEES